MEALKAHFESIKSVHMRDLFAREGDSRFQRLHLQFDDILVDFSKNRVTSETMTLLMQLAKERQVEQRRDAMLRGQIVNVTEKRAVLHTALRGDESSSVGREKKKKKKKTPFVQNGVPSL